MIKINLLPKTINQKVILRNTALAFGALFIAVVAGGVTYYMSLKNQVDVQTELTVATEAQKARVVGLQGQASSLRSSITPITEKLTLINSVLKYNLEFPRLYNDITRWTYKNVQYVSMSSDGMSVQLSGRVKSLDDLGRYQLNLYQATDLFSRVSVTFGGGAGAPGGGGPAYQAPAMAGGTGSMAGIGAISAGVERTPVAGVPGGIDFSVTCQLVPNRQIAPVTFKGQPVVGGLSPTVGSAPGMPPAAPPAVTPMPRSTMPST